MSIPKHIFKTYDIRGVYPTELNEEGTYKVARAFGTHLINTNRKNCVLGMDCRASSPLLLNSFCQGLIDCGINVTEVGLITTPMLHFFTSTLSFDSGVIITASHNPKEYNGIKLETNGAEPFAKEEWPILFDIINSGDFVQGRGDYVKEDLSDDYSTYMLEKFKFKKRYNIGVLCGGGATGPIVAKTLRKLNVNALILGQKPDGSFEKYVPDPENIEYISNLSKLVTKEKLDLGFAFDTDGDRLGVCDSNGKIHHNDYICLLLSKYLLINNPNSTVLFDVKSSGILFKYISDYGGVPKMIPTGRYGFLKGMKNALLGSEFAGHTYVSGDYFGYDDGLYTMLLIIKALEYFNVSLQEFMDQYPKLVTSEEIKVNLSDDEKQEVLGKIIDNSLKYPLIKERITIDGIRGLISDSGWFLIRSSGTSPYLSIRYEGANKEEYEKVENIVFELLKPYTSKAV